MRKKVNFIKAFKGKSVSGVKTICGVTADRLTRVFR